MTAPFQPAEWKRLASFYASEMRDISPRQSSGLPVSSTRTTALPHTQIRPREAPWKMPPVSDRTKRLLAVGAGTLHGIVVPAALLARQPDGNVAASIRKRRMAPR